MKKLSIALALVLMGGIATAQEGLPANPKPGTCYVRCISHDEFRETEQKIMVRPEYNKLEIVPATYKTVEERVMVKEASKKYIYVPATYTTTEVSYVSKEGRTDLSINPATFTDGSETITTHPATSGWEVTTAKNCKSLNPADCQAMCFVERPASTKTVALKKLGSNAGTNNVPVAEQKATYKKQVIKTPARYDEIDIPAEYATIKRQVVDRPASTKTVTVPAEYVTVKKTELVKAGSLGHYEEIDCKLVNYNALPINWDLASATLTPDAKRIIDEHLLKLLVGKPGVSVEIASHTDSRASSSYNMNLSQRRADSVVNYLVSKGIKRSRLVAKGYGETMLLNKCADGVECSEAEHAVNRRTEFRVINAN